MEKASHILIIFKIITLLAVHIFLDGFQLSSPRDFPVVIFFINFSRPPGALRVFHFVVIFYPHRTSP